MRRPARNLLYVVLGFVCVALLVQGVGLKLPGIMRALTAVSGATALIPVLGWEPGRVSGRHDVLPLTPSEKACTGLSSIESSFNSTPIAEGNFIWFNSAIHVDGLGSDAATIFLNDSAITFAANGTNYSLAVPAATITFDPAATAASTSFDAASNRWATIVPGGLLRQGVPLRPRVSGSRRGPARRNQFGHLVRGVLDRHARRDRAVGVGRRGLHHVQHRLQRPCRQSGGRGPAEPGRQDALQSGEQRERGRPDGFRRQAGESRSLRDRRRGWRRRLRFHGILRGDEGRDERCDALRGGCQEQLAVDHHSGQRRRRDGKSCRDGKDFSTPRYGVNQEL